MRFVRFSLLSTLVVWSGVTSAAFAAPPTPKADAKASAAPAKIVANGSAAVTASKAAVASKPIVKPVEFLRDVAPILDRNSCSTAACHGKFGGRGGFQISLLTLSPEDDYEPLIYGARGRRINFAEPEKSLLLLKAAGQVPHGGGPRFRARFARLQHAPQLDQAGRAI